MRLSTGKLAPRLARSWATARVGPPPSVAEIGLLVCVEAIRVHLAEDGQALSYHFAADQAVGPDIRAAAHDPRGGCPGGYASEDPTRSGLWLRANRARTSDPAKWAAAGFNVAPSHPSACERGKKNTLPPCSR